MVNRLPQVFAVANKLCGTYIFDAINMPLTSSVRDIVAEVKEWLSAGHITRRHYARRYGFSDTTL